MRNEKRFLLAVVKSYKNFYCFLLPKRFLLRTNNTQVKAFIKNLLSSRPEAKRLIRWQMLLAEYDFNIEKSINKISITTKDIRYGYRRDKEQIKTTKISITTTDIRYGCGRDKEHIKTMFY